MIFYFSASNVRVKRDFEHTFPVVWWTFSEQKKKENIFIYIQLLSAAH